MIDEDRLREDVRTVLMSDVPAPSPGFEARVMSEMYGPAVRRRSRPGRWFETPSFALTGTAFVLAVALVTTLLVWPNVNKLPGTSVTPQMRAGEPNLRIPASSSRDNPRLQFFTPDTGWLTVTRGESSYLYKTADGGNTWAGSELKMTTPVNGSFATRFFTNKKGIVGAYGKELLLWRTEDGGKSWIPIPILFGGRAAHAWDFINTKEGWVLYDTDPLQQTPSPGKGYSVVEGYFIAHTVDAGDHWEVSKAALEVIGSGLRFLNSKRGFLAGDYKELPLQGTRDGGATWQPVELTFPDEALKADWIHLRAPGFFNTHDGVMILVTSTGRFYSYTTANGGDTWSAPKRLPGGDDTSSMTQISFANPDTWWLASDRNLWTSVDGGKTWRTVRTPLPGVVGELEAVDDNRAWIMSGGLMYRTTDGGASWLLVTTPPK